MSKARTEPNGWLKEWGNSTVAARLSLIREATIKGRHSETLLATFSDPTDLPPDVQSGISAARSSNGVGGRQD